MVHFEVGARGYKIGSCFGEPMLDCTRTYLGSVEGPMRGRDGNVHRGRPSEGMPAMISHLGTAISVVSGMLMAKRLKGQMDGVVGSIHTRLDEIFLSIGATGFFLNERYQFVPSHIILGFWSKIVHCAPTRQGNCALCPHPSRNPGDGPGPSRSSAP